MELPITKSTAGELTRINVFSGRPEDQAALVASRSETIAAAARVPGWIGAAVHTSTDGRRVPHCIRYEDEDEDEAAIDGATYRVAAVLTR